MKVRIRHGDPMASTSHGERQEDGSFIVPREHLENFMDQGWFLDRAPIEEPEPAEPIKEPGDEDGDESPQEPPGVATGRDDGVQAANAPSGELQRKPAPPRMRRKV